MTVIGELYEHRVVNIVKGLIKEHELENDPETGEELEKFLVEHRAELGVALLDDIQMWMGFDDLLKQVQE